MFALILQGEFCQDVRLILNKVYDLVKDDQELRKFWGSVFAVFCKVRITVAGKVKVCSYSIALHICVGVNLYMHP